MVPSRCARVVLPCLFVFCATAPSHRASAQTRVFLAPDGQQADVATTANTEMVVDAGDTVTIGIWFQGFNPVVLPLLNSAQMIVDWQATPISAVGSISYVPSTIEIDEAHTGIDGELDWLFLDQMNALPVFTQEPDDYFGFFNGLADPSAGFQPPGGIRYLGLFDLTVASDAVGTFELRFHDDPPLSALFTPNGDTFITDEFQNMTIFVRCTDTQLCDDADACTQNICDPDTNICSFPPVDCSGDSTDCLLASCDPEGVEGNCDITADINEAGCCDDGDPCTDPGICETGVCIPGPSVDCSGVLVDCNTAACDPSGDQGNCDLLMPQANEAACESTGGTCDNGTCEEVRLFMARDGEAAAAAQTANTTVYMAPGSVERVMVWIEDHIQAQLLGAYQLIIDRDGVPQGGASGSVSYVDLPGSGQSVAFDTERNDFVFAGGTVGPVPFESGTQFGGVMTLQEVMGVQVQGIRYLAEFELETSADAAGSFALPFAIGVPLSTFLAQTNGSEIVIHEAQTLTIVVADDCSSFTECADVDGDGRRDDNCVWHECAGTCLPTAISFADMGGPFGDCVPDGTCDSNDRFHALNCFANADTTGPGSTYPCEFDTPSATNVDAGGAFGSCIPDGACDGNDAFHALNCFISESTCSCPNICPQNGDAPTPQAPAEASQTAEVALQLVADSQDMRAGQDMQVHVFAGEPLKDLRGYQLHMAARGGRRGSLDLVDITIAPQHASKLSGQHVFEGLPFWSAFNLRSGQMVAGLDGTGVSTPQGAYLATWTYRASATARGQFAIELHHDLTDPDQRTFMFPTPANGHIAVLGATPVRVHVSGSGGRLTRR